ncbi:MAG: two-component sensor histidine kinase, partial [Oscillospiraceae bacterium]|nr:two-component sensor histidine kinase [Oscillospiraceae bacterium]
MKQRQKSMEELINRRIILVGLCSVLLTALLSLTLFYRAFDRQVRQDLAAETAMLAAAYRHSCTTPQDLAPLAAPGLRVTLIGREGQVLFDSSAGQGLENHNSRPEFLAALETGEGSARRQSATLGRNTYYHALLTDDGCVLRTAREARSASSLFTGALPVLGLCCLLVVLASVGASLLLTRTLVRPVLALGQDLSRLPEQMPYRELEPFGAALRADLAARENQEKLRREFTANVSHELKTPLTSISGYAELLESGMARPEDLPLFAGRIRAEAGRMQALVGDIIQLSALESQAAGPAPTQKVGLKELADRCAESLKMNARKAYVTLSAGGSPAQVNGVPHLLEELCINLCDNAIRYNRPGGRVEISTGHTPGGKPFLKVEDNGIGIPLESRN